MSELEKKLKLIKDSILTIPDYPQKGVLFRDITALLQNPEAFKASVELLINYYKKKGIDKVVGTEARGFIFAAPLALALNIPLILK